MTDDSPRLTPAGARAVRAVGLALSLAGLAFLANALWTSDGWDAIRAVPMSTLGAAAALMMAGNACLGVAWILLLTGTIDGVRDPALIAAYGRSVMAKYIPGNVFQFVSRQSDLAGTRYTQRDIAAASAREIAGMAAAATGIIAAACAFGGAGDVLAMKLGLQTDWVRTLSLLLPLGWLLAAALALWAGALRVAPLILYGCYLLIFEVAGRLLLASLMPDAALPVPGLLSLAWLAGYVVIGSPGGLGVREWAIVALLAPALPTEKAAAFAFAFRLVAISADALYRAATFAITRR